MKFIATKQPVRHGRDNSPDIPPTDFLEEIVQWGREVPDDIFMLNNEPNDVFTSIHEVRGLWHGTPLTSSWFLHRKAVMLEVLRVLGAFESTWNWNEGKDMASHSENDTETMSAGLWQISYNSRNFGSDLKHLLEINGVRDGEKFQKLTKHDHNFAITYAARLFRHTTHHNGPLLRHEVDRQFSNAAVKEFSELLA